MNRIAHAAISGSRIWGLDGVNEPETRQAIIAQTGGIVSPCLCTM